MAFRLHSRLIAWNLLLVSIISSVLAFVLSPAELVHLHPSRRWTHLYFRIWCAAGSGSARSTAFLSASRKLAAGHLNQRLPITGDEEIAALGTSLNTMAQTLSEKIHALSDGKQQLELILEAMEQGVMVLDRDARITLTNSSSAPRPGNGSRSLRQKAHSRCCAGPNSTTPSARFSAALLREFWNSAPGTTEFFRQTLRL